MNEKTLVEQLRDIGNDKTSKPTCQQVFSLLHDGAKCFSTPCDKCDYIKGIANRIEAEYTLNSEIEAKYMAYPLDADGVPCKVGDYVECFAILANGERTESRCHGKIQSMILCARNSWLFMVENGEEAEDGEPVTQPWCPRNVVHVEPPKPLTAEYIDAMSRTVSSNDFWGCRESYICDDCPSKIDGKKPYEYYSTSCCGDARVPHILRLERERVAGEQV